eukprot:Opistho-2@41405
MDRINSSTGASISVFHSFHDEVDSYRQHWWLCDGPCKGKPPYFGLVKRAMNRPPSARDPWWIDHQLNCGGTYTKIKEPEKRVNKTTASEKGGDGPGKRAKKSGEGDVGTPSIVDAFKRVASGKKSEPGDQLKNDPADEKIGSGVGKPRSFLLGGVPMEPPLATDNRHDGRSRDGPWACDDGDAHVLCVD